MSLSNVPRGRLKLVKCPTGDWKSNVPLGEGDWKSNVPREIETQMSGGHWECQGDVEDVRGTLRTVVGLEGPNSGEREIEIKCPSRRGALRILNVPWDVENSQRPVGHWEFSTSRGMLRILRRSGDRLGRGCSSPSPSPPPRLKLRQN